MSVVRFVLMWTLLAVAMTLNGMFRELVLKRAMASGVAGGVSAAMGITIIGLVTRWGFRPIAGASAGATTLWTLSVALIVLTVGFETALGRLVDHKSWSQLVQHYALWRGELWPIVLAWLAATPFVWSRWWQP